MRARQETLAEEKGDAVTFPQLFSRVEQRQQHQKKKKKKEKKAEEQEGGGGREEGQQEQQKQPVVATKRGTTLGNRGVVLKSFAEARLIFKLLAPPDSGESQEERNGKEMKRKGQRGTEGGEGTF